MLNLHLQPTHTFSLVYIWFELKTPSYILQRKIFCPVSALNIHNLLLVPIVPLSRLNPFRVLRETKSWVRLFVLMVIALHFTWVQTGEPRGRWRTDSAGRVGVPATYRQFDKYMCRSHVVVRDLELIICINAVFRLQIGHHLAVLCYFRNVGEGHCNILPRVEVVMCSCVIVSSTSAVTRLSHYTEPQHNKLNS